MGEETLFSPISPLRPNPDLTYLLKMDFIALNAECKHDCLFLFFSFSSVFHPFLIFSPVIKAERMECKESRPRESPVEVDLT
jgi:hypothetical protein